MVLLKVSWNKNLRYWEGRDRDFWFQTLKRTVQLIQSILYWQVTPIRTDHFIQQEES